MFDWIKFLQLSVKESIVCETCGEQISLVGRWRCSCGFCYQSHLLRYCALCHTLPKIARCYACGCTTKLPEP